MALQKPIYETNFGVTLENVYAKITGVSYNANTDECFIHLEYYVSKQSCDDGNASLGQYTNSFTPQDPNGDLRAQSYTYLKTLPDFSDYIDV